MGRLVAKKHQNSPGYRSRIRRRNRGYGERRGNLKSRTESTGEGHIACGHCRNCRRGKLHVCENSISVGVNRDGAFAEYLSLPATNAVKLDPRIPDEIATIMDPFGNATHTALAFSVLGEDVLITGAGLIGNMATAICNLPEHATSW